MDISTPPEPENTKRLNPDNHSNQLLQLNADALRRRLLGAMLLHGLQIKKVSILQNEVRLVALSPPPEASGFEGRST